MSSAVLQPCRSELILGGQKSGKSRRAELLAQTWLAQSAAHRAVLIATAQPWDEEMRQRIERHQQDRAARVPGMATLAFGFIVEEVLARWESVTGGNAGLHVKAPQIMGWSLSGGETFYFLCLCITVLATLGLLNLLRSPTGRAFVAIRDSEISAQSMGIHLAHYKTLSFALSAALAGVAGALYAHKLQFISPDQFNILQSIDLLLMIVIGGLGSVHGAFLGAIFLISMPQLISLGKDWLPDSIGQSPGLQAVVYGVVLIAFVLFEPMGLYGRWLKVRTWLQMFPFYRKGLFKRQKSFQKSDRLK